MTHSFKLPPRTGGLRVAALATVLLFSASCNSDSLNPSEVESPDDVGVEGSDVLPVEGPAFSISGNRRGTQFGLWQLDWSQLSDQWTSLKKATSPSSIRQDLERARGKGA